MKITTRNFGEVVIDDEKIITFSNGIVGFPELKQFTLIHNEEKDKVNSLYWDEKDSFYYDIDCNTHDFYKIMSIASYLFVPNATLTCLHGFINGSFGFIIVLLL